MVINYNTQNHTGLEFKLKSDWDLARKPFRDSRGPEIPKSTVGGKPIVPVWKDMDVFFYN